jgi:hypothetical protein
MTDPTYEELWEGNRRLFEAVEAAGKLHQSYEASLERAMEHIGALQQDNLRLTALVQQLLEKQGHQWP